jgi:hypothetical protein
VKVADFGTSRLLNKVSDHDRDRDPSNRMASASASTLESLVAGLFLGRRRKSARAPLSHTAQRVSPSTTATKTTTTTTHSHSSGLSSNDDSNSALKSNISDTFEHVEESDVVSRSMSSTMTRGIGTFSLPPLSHL